MINRQYSRNAIEQIDGGRSMFDQATYINLLLSVNDLAVIIDYLVIYYPRKRCCSIDITQGRIDTHSSALCNSSLPTTIKYHEINLTPSPVHPLRPNFPIPN